MGKIIATEVKVWPNDRPVEGHADNPVIVNTYGGTLGHVEIEVQRPGKRGIDNAGKPYVVTRIYLSKNNAARLIAQLADALEDA